MVQVYRRFGKSYSIHLQGSKTHQVSTVLCADVIVWTLMMYTKTIIGSSSIWSSENNLSYKFTAKDSSHGKNASISFQFLKRNLGEGLAPDSCEEASLPPPALLRCAGMSCFRGLSGDVWYRHDILRNPNILPGSGGRAVLRRWRHDLSGSTMPYTSRWVELWYLTFIEPFTQSTGPKRQSSWPDDRTIM